MVEKRYGNKIYKQNSVAAKSVQESNKSVTLGDQKLTYTFLVRD